MSTTLPIAVPGPFADALDYLLASDGATPSPGSRVRVPLGRRQVVGIVVGLPKPSKLARHKLKAITERIDPQPVLDHELLDLILWAARYYHHPMGDALLSALPARLRQGHAANPSAETQWQASAAGVACDLASFRRRAPRQAMLLETLLSAKTLSAAQLVGLGGDARGALQRLVDAGLAVASTHHDYGLIQGQALETAHSLNPAQHQCAVAIQPGLGPSVHCIDGVTGSGKTEVYLDAIQRAIDQGLQTLVIVPEIGLTPQLLTRFQRRLNARIGVLHSGLSDSERLNAWLAAQAGEANVLIGTRSAIFVPLAAPGLMIVDEEHDASLKQQEGFRYSARDLAILRAHRLNIPIALGSATPSLESLANAMNGRYHHHQLIQRAGQAKAPLMQILDMRGQPTHEGLSEPLIERVNSHLSADGQVLLFLNRRGFSPTLICHECGWLAECERCDARMTYHRGKAKLHCHHCDREQSLLRTCPTCDSVDLRPLGLGTERIEQALQVSFPETPLVRIDRDSTRQRGSFERQMDAAQRGESRLLLGTQMLAKGHHLPAVTLVGVIDADQGLFGADFRAAERLAQLIVQVAGRAGRAERAGEVAIQTHHPEHPLLQMLIHGGYPAFAQAALAEREAAGLPPARAMALIRAEAVEAAAPVNFLRTALALAPAVSGVERLGPYPAPMERRAGRYRAQIMLQADDRAPLQNLLRHWLPLIQGLPQARKVRWSIDVDPAETL
ncbi:MAG: primosomal protein N' [Spiribacter sp.]|jgi:primosomal protein N' (replication factor Y)|nr:primosomal protein N' [Spiribacter sp.]MDR9488782.1 primosomal protein N' [Spiribacter sp.]